METSWAMSSNADVDDDFFSTIESKWNNDNMLLAPMNSTVTTNDSRNRSRSSSISNNSNSNKNQRDTQSSVLEYSSGSSIKNQDNNNSNGNNNDNNNEQIDSIYGSNNNVEVIVDSFLAQDDDTICRSKIEKNDVSIDALLAKELNSLSFQQRESINEGIHGVNVNQIYVDRIKVTEETPQLLNTSFVKLQIELNKLQPNSFAFNRCQQLYGDDKATNATTDGNIAGKSYINTNEFRIIFLRRALFDVTRAALRFVNYVELMYELYGDVGIQRRIRLDDLSEQERRILELGYIQILPGRDRAGRRILVNVAFNSTNEYTANSRIRVWYYVSMSAITDVETQRKGCVFIGWFHNVNIFDDFTVRGKTFSSAKSSPIRFDATHICIPEEFEDNNYLVIPSLSSGEDSDSSVATTSSLKSATPANVIKSMIALSIGRKGRHTLRFHTGSVMECLYVLQSFGIPSNQIPVVVGTSSNKKRRRKETKRKNNNNNNKTNLKLENHIKWLNLCQLKDSNVKSCGKKWKNYDDNHHEQIIECPKHSDILFGRGREVMKHAGNTLLRSIVISKLDEYSLLDSCTETIKLTLDVVHSLKNKHGARFLKEETIETNGKLGCWIEVTDEAARIKVRVLFRDKIKLQQPQQKNKPKTTATATATPTMIMAATDINYNPLNNSNDNQQIQQYQQVDEEVSNSNTSMFLTMTGGNNNCGSDRCCNGTIVG